MFKDEIGSLYCAHTHLLDNRLRQSLTHLLRLPRRPVNARSDLSTSARAEYSLIGGVDCGVSGTEGEIGEEKLACDHDLVLCMSKINEVGRQRLMSRGVSWARVWEVEVGGLGKKKRQYDDGLANSCVLTAVSGHFGERPDSAKERQFRRLSSCCTDKMPAPVDLGIPLY